MDRLPIRASLVRPSHALPLPTRFQLQGTTNARQPNSLSILDLMRNEPCQIPPISSFDLDGPHRPARAQRWLRRLLFPTPTAAAKTDTRPFLRYDQPDTAQARTG